MLTNSVFVGVAGVRDGDNSVSLNSSELLSGTIQTPTHATFDINAVDSLFGSKASLFFNGTQLVGLSLTEEKGDFPPFTIFHTFATVDVDSVLGGGGSSAGCYL